MQSGFQHLMGSLSTKVTKTYDIDITLIWMQLHVILSNFARRITVRNCKYLIYAILLCLSHLVVAECGFLTGCYIGTKFASVNPSVNNLH